MADDSSGIGVGNVIVAAMILLVVGGVVLYTAGVIGPEQLTLLSSK